ncbi:DivIVA domain-containing protein [Granulicatella sp. zg-ZJ]|uniref:DivIVA domain-containing protein n=1 Tax=unclassified Granulicatella TaxID=2630493 RepID=UPI0013C2143C|nr:MULTISPECIES: DivIVA domain-containing protein [unclassified Granulicatella]MBS4750554.1 DivIVA domain-containing protein [Carnobacteriaceae bacterium zg-ZUI78]NEW62935.1 DivIVA domain-containing protein [Granulicatella sp. zg-ZJ]NEW66713.1 DivIVA domain-containing protein [Granulicatella sp. zg-84]QMI85308.1 DivIVA domain-containing protein [Carnobacteriaceae bacterium zg-84]
MSITPIDISSKEFSKKFKGYNPDEVDDFLDRIMLEMESLIKEKRELEKKIKFMGEQVEHYMSLQDTLNKSIVVAQDAADRVKENAEKEAEIIVSEAQRTADDLVNVAVEKATRIANETDTLRKTAIVFRKKFQLLVESQLDLIQNEEWDHLLETQPNPVDTPTVDEFLDGQLQQPVTVNTSEIDLSDVLPIQ